MLTLLLSYFPVLNRKIVSTLNAAFVGVVIITTEATFTAFPHITGRCVRVRVFVGVGFAGGLVVWCVRVGVVRAGTGAGIGGLVVRTG